MIRGEHICFAINCCFFPSLDEASAASQQSLPSRKPHGFPHDFYRRFRCKGSLKPIPWNMFLYCQCIKRMQPLDYIIWLHYIVPCGMESSRSDACCSHHCKWQVNGCQCPKYGIIEPWACCCGLHWSTTKTDMGQNVQWKAISLSYLFWHGWNAGDAMQNAVASGQVLQNRSLRLCSEHLRMSGRHGGLLPARTSSRWQDAWTTPKKTNCWNINK